MRAYRARGSLERASDARSASRHRPKRRHTRGHRGGDLPLERRHEACVHLAQRQRVGERLRCDRLGDRRLGRATLQQRREHSAVQPAHDRVGRRALELSASSYL